MTAGRARSREAVTETHVSLTHTFTTSSRAMRGETLAWNIDEVAAELFTAARDPQLRAARDKFF